MLDSLQQACALAFSDVEGFVEAALSEARSAADTNRADADRLRGELSGVDQEIAHFTRLLKDAAVMAEPLAFKQLLRQSAGLEEKRQGIKVSLGKLLDKSNDDTDVLAGKIRRKMVEARDRWSVVASPSQLNRLIQDFVGPSLVTADGRLLAVGSETTPPSDGSEGGVRGYIAGGRCYPVHTDLTALFGPLLAEAWALERRAVA